MSEPLKWLIKFKTGKNEEQHIDIDIPFDNMAKVSRDIFIELNRNQCYTIKHNVKEDVVRSFINFWEKGTEPEITVDNYLDFCHLNNEFDIGFIGEYINKKQDIFNDYQKLMQNLKDDEYTNKHVIEIEVAKKMDIFVLRYSDELFSLPKQQLIRLFGNQELILKEPEFAYQAIVRYFQQSNDLEIFILLPYLDGSKLTKESIEECFEKQEERAGFLPKIGYTSIEEKMKRNDRKISELESILNQQNDQIHQLQSEIDTAKTDFANQLSQKESQIQKLESNIKNLFRILLDNHSLSEITNFFIPTGQNWNQDNINQFSISYQNVTYIINASSTFQDKAENSLIQLFNGKNEQQGGHFWRTQNCTESYIQITFSQPVHANIISITAVDQNVTESPSRFDILGGNDQENFIVLKSLDLWHWYKNERKIFSFDNNQSYKSYKLIFKVHSSLEGTEHYFSISELNIGEIPY